MRKNRRRSWVVLLALTLGLLVWWGLGWYLAPRPLYTLTFPYHQGFRRVIGATERSPDDAVVELKGEVWSFHVGPMDHDDHFLSIQLPRVPEEERLTMKVYDLQLGKLLASTDESVEERGNAHIHFEPYPGREAEGNGDLYLLTSKMTKEELVQVSLLKWNMLTNKRELVRTWPPGTQVMLSKKGQTLIERNVFSPLLPDVLCPMNWSNYLSTLMLLNQTNSMNELGVVRIGMWTLPKLQSPYTMYVPSPKGYTETLLTQEGRWLLAANIDIAFLEHSRGEPKLDQPAEISIYDLHSGQVFQSVAGHPCISFGLQELGPDLFQTFLRKDPDPKATKEREARQERERAERQRIESEENNGEVVEFLGSRLRELPMGYVHLPSNKWISVKDQGFRESVYAPDSPGSIRVLAGTDSGAPYRVWEIDESGGLKEIRELPNEFAFGNDFECVPQLIPRSNQCFFVRSANWPHWLREQGMKISFLQDFFRPQRREMVIMDYIKERELAVIRVGTRDVSRAQISPKGNYLIVEHRDDQDHEVMVFSLPVADWSPWWSRCAGLLTFIIIWFAFRKLARR